MKKLLVSMITLFTITAMSMAVPIAFIQQEGVVGEMYEIQGCITALTTSGGLDGFVVQDAEAAWSGIQVYGDNVGLAVGMEVLVIGEMLEYYGWTELVIPDVPSSVMVLGEDCYMTPLELTIAEGFTEPYAAVLCSFPGVVCTNEDLGYGEWEISDGTGFGPVDDALTYPESFEPGQGDCYDVTGVMWYSYGAYKVEPRSFNDIVEIPCGGVTEIEPVAYSLNGNYPNPFNPTTTIDFDLAEPGQVSLSVFDMAGHQVATLVDGNLSAGSHSVNFDGSNLSSGIYFYMIQAGNFTDTRKMVLVK